MTIVFRMFTLLLAFVFTSGFMFGGFDEGDHVWINLPADSVAGEGFASGHVLKAEGDNLLIKLEKVFRNGSNDAVAKKLQPGADVFIPETYLRKFEDGQNSYDTRRSISDDFDAVFSALYNSKEHNNFDVLADRISTIQKRANAADIDEIENASAELLKFSKFFEKTSKFGKVTADNTTDFIKMMQDHLLNDFATELKDKDKVAKALSEIKSFAPANKSLMRSMLSLKLINKSDIKNNILLFSTLSYTDREAAMAYMTIFTLETAAVGAVQTAGADYYLDNKDKIKEFASHLSDAATLGGKQPYSGMDANAMSKSIMSKIRQGVADSKRKSVLSDISTKIKAHKESGGDYVSAKTMFEQAIEEAKPHGKALGMVMLSKKDEKSVLFDFIAEDNAAFKNALKHKGGLWGTGQNAAQYEADLNAYLAAYPGGVNFDEATKFLDELKTSQDKNLYRKAKSVANIPVKHKEALTTYLEQYPNGIHALEAKEKLAGLAEMEKQSNADKTQYANQLEELKQQYASNEEQYKVILIQYESIKNSQTISKKDKLAAKKSIKLIARYMKTSLKNIEKAPVDKNSNYRKSAIKNLEKAKSAIDDTNQLFKPLASS